MEEMKSSLTGMEEMKSDDDGIRVTVADPGGNKLTFKMKKYTLLKKLMTSYCQQKNVSINNLRFLLDGDRLTENDSLEKIEYTSDKIIEVFPLTDGGFQ